MKRIGVVFILLIAAISFSGCKPLEGEGFAIYLLARDIPVSKMPVLSHVDLADRPLISLADIVSYSINTHEIQLTTEAYGRLMNLEVPVIGEAFVVCVDHYPVYWGAFWTPISSLPFDGITILKPNESTQHLIQLQLGYPSPQFFKGEDYRSDRTILESLERTGKLH